MKVKSALAIACLALAFFIIGGTTRAEAQCCGLDILAGPFVAAGAIAYGAVAVSAAIVTAPFTALSCGSCGVNLCNTCGFNLCNPCGSPPVSYVPGKDDRF